MYVREYLELVEVCMWGAVLHVCWCIYVFVHVLCVLSVDDVAVQTLRVYMDVWLGLAGWLVAASLGRQVGRSARRTASCRRYRQQPSICVETITAIGPDRSIRQSK